MRPLLFFIFFSVGFGDGEAGAFFLFSPFPFRSLRLFFLRFVRVCVCRGGVWLRGRLSRGCLSLGVWRSFACERGASFHNHRRRGVWFLRERKKTKGFVVVRVASSSSSVAQTTTKL